MEEEIRRKKNIPSKDMTKNNYFLKSKGELENKFAL